MEVCLDSGLEAGLVDVGLDVGLDIGCDVGLDVGLEVWSVSGRHRQRAQGACRLPRCRKQRVPPACTVALRRGKLAIQEYASVGSLLAVQGPRLQHELSLISFLAIKPFGTHGSGGANGSVHFVSLA